jgi:hypothetical protein
MGARGREFVEQRHSKERLASDVIALYEELTGAGAARSARAAEAHTPDASNALRRG